MTHDSTFYVTLLTALEKEKMLEEYRWGCEYKRGVIVGRKLKMIPPDFDPDQFPTIGHYNRHKGIAL
jgi:hypothetical protein